MNAQTKFYLDQLRPLVGGKIVRLAICDDDDEEEYFGLVISMPKGKTKILIFLRDDEGNGPGSFEIQDEDLEDDE